MLNLNFIQVTRKILIVANDPRQRRIMLGLKNLGYDTVLAETGREALELAVAHAPDLIMLDLTLPDMDGLEAARRIREHPTTCFIPILAITGRSLTEERKRSLEDGCEDYIYKPLARSLLVSRVEKLLA